MYLRWSGKSVKRKWLSLIGFWHTSFAYHLRPHQQHETSLTFTTFSLFNALIALIAGLTNRVSLFLTDQPMKVTSSPIPTFHFEPTLRVSFINQFLSIFLIQRNECLKGIDRRGASGASPPIWLQRNILLVSLIYTDYFTSDYAVPLLSYSIIWCQSNKCKQKPSWCDFVYLHASLSSIAHWILQVNLPSLFVDTKRQISTKLSTSSQECCLHRSPVSFLPKVVP